MSEAAGSWFEGVLREYGEAAERIPWADAGSVARAREARERIAAGLVARGAAWSALGSKIRIGELSPGCAACAAGTWSCLFVNGCCQGRCFFCPSPQDEPGVACASTVPFPDPEDYADYVRIFGIRGVGLSGGEPLLTLERTLSFVRALREADGDLYIWLYTNGLAGSEGIFETLGRAGLDEVRFNLCASRYRTKLVVRAVGRIPRVTVEIPAIPEDEDRLREALVELDRVGVRHLNLHRLRPSPHSLGRFLGRPYTYLPSPRVCVLESENTALRLMEVAQDRGLSMGVHYCASVYQHRWQERASRARFAPFVRKPHEDVAPTGLIRDLSVGGEAASALGAALESASVPRSDWCQDSAGRLHFRACHLHRVPEREEVLGSWFSAAVAPTPSLKYPFQKVHFGRDRAVVVERRPVAVGISVAHAQRAALRSLADRHARSPECPVRGVPEALPWDEMGEGLD